MSPRYWEQKLESEYKRNSHSQEVLDLDYLLEKVSHGDLAHNLHVCYRSDLANKALVGQSQKREALQMRLKQQNERKLDSVLENLEKALKEQRAELADLKASSLDATSDEIRKLRQDWSKRRPLSKEDVEELVILISEQPKEIEKQSEALTEELTSKVTRLLILQLLGRQLG
uniref:Uncharacterized protein n=1 Tax=Pineapple bacilliform CO virus TaxID=2033633 RepID=G8Z331_9VIRU|nr:hypothetical protein [Pineapple bacilliform CO virus]